MTKIDIHVQVQFLEDDKYGLLIFHAENLDGVLELDNGKRLHLCFILAFANLCLTQEHHVHCYCRSSAFNECLARSASTTAYPNAPCYAGCVIKAARETAALMFGVPVSEMLGRDLSEFLPHACPSRNAEDMLIVGDATSGTASGNKRGGMGGKKKVVGKLMPLVRYVTVRLRLL